MRRQTALVRDALCASGACRVHMAQRPTWLLRSLAAGICRARTPYSRSCFFPVYASNRTTARAKGTDWPWAGGVSRRLARLQGASWHAGPCERAAQSDCRAPSANP